MDQMYAALSFQTLKGYQSSVCVPCLCPQVITVVCVFSCLSPGCVYCTFGSLDCSRQGEKKNKNKKKPLWEFTINTDKYRSTKRTVQKSMECIIFNSKYRAKSLISFLVIVLPFPIGSYKAIKIIADGISDRVHWHARECICVYLLEISVLID